ncbi:MAG: flagellar hook-length control protein FliK, partial [Azoarcus sp.]|nr:flagellar hook-length control protein FliK [Azoarcus sp.]
TTEEHAQTLNPKNSANNATDNAAQPQASVADASIDPTPAATIAALLGGIAVAETNTNDDAETIAAETIAESATDDALRAKRPNPRLAQTGDDAAESAGEEQGNAGTSSRAFTETSHSRGAMPAAESAAYDRAAATIKGGDAAPLNIAAGAAAAVAADPRAVTLAARAQGTASNATNANVNSNSSSTNPANSMPLLNMPRPAGQTALQFSIPAGVGQNAWAEDVSNRVMWMLGRAESRAELILTPPHLGKVEVSINLNGDHGTAQFLASSQAARDALEQAMPRLRELLAQAGISLGEASVNTSSGSQPRSEEESGANPGHFAGHAGSNEGGNDDATPVTSANWTRFDNGLVNTFA